MRRCIPRRCYLLGVVGSATAERAQRRSDGRWLKRRIAGERNGKLVVGFGFAWWVKVSKESRSCEEVLSDEAGIDVLYVSHCFKGKDTTQGLLGISNS